MNLNSEARALLALDPQATDQEIADSINNLADRFIETRINTEAIVALTGNTDATNAIYAALSGSQDTTLQRSANAIDSVGINLGNLIVRGLVSGLGLDPTLTATLLGLAEDTHGGDVTPQDVADALLQNKHNDALADYREAKNLEYQQTCEAAQALRDASIVAYEAVIQTWDGNGDPPEGD